MKNLIQAAVVTLSTASTVQAQQAVQWKVSDGGNGHWYQATSIRFRNFAAAQTFAVQAGGHLVTLTSEGENGFVSAMATGEFLLGGFQDLSSQGYSEPSGGWKWVTGEPWQFTRWRAGEPNNNGQIDANAASEQYLLWWRFGLPANDEWNDGFNDATAEFSWDIRAIIEWSADCNNDGIVDYGQCRDGSLPDVNGNNIPDCCEQGTGCDPLAVGLQAHYRLDGNCLDSSGNGRNGSATGLGYTVAPPGLAGTAASFDGSTSFIQVDGVPIPADNAFSWALWLRVDDLGNSHSYVIERIADLGNNLLSPGLRVQADGSLHFGSCCTAGGSETETPAGTVAAGTWAHVACTSSTAGVRSVYVNGSLVGQGFAVDYGQQLPRILVGRDRLDCCDRFRGAIDDLRFYSRPLAAAEVAVLSAAGLSCRDADLFPDGRVGGDDLGILLVYWGPVTTSAASRRSDINRDGFVNGDDLGFLLTQWGPCAN